MHDACIAVLNLSHIPVPALILTLTLTLIVTRLAQAEHSCGSQTGKFDVSEAALPAGITENKLWIDVINGLVEQGLVVHTASANDAWTSQNGLLIGELKKLRNAVEVAYAPELVRLHQL